MALALHQALRALRLSSRPPVRPAEPLAEPLAEPPAEHPAEPPAEHPAEHPAETEEPLLRGRARAPAGSLHEWNALAVPPKPSRARMVDFNACCGDPEPPEPIALVAPPEPVQLVELAENLEVVLPFPSIRVALSAEEQYLKQWHDEAAQNCAEKFLWVDCDREDSVKVHFTEERLREIGIEASGTHLFWIQDKPEELMNRFGHWDPVSARWRILPDHIISQIEQRIAPLGAGYGSTEMGAVCGETDSFLSHEYDSSRETYKHTGLEPGFDYISSQLENLPGGTSIPVASGWGTDGNGKRLYYTPHLRHVVIDEAVQEEDGKRYVYSPGKRAVKPVAVEAEWSSANSCWVLSDRTSNGEILEREADVLLGQ